MNCARIFILHSLNEKHHQESGNGSSCIDDQLPCVRKIKVRTANNPNNNNKKCNNESNGRTTENSCSIASFSKMFAFFFIFQFLIFYYFEVEFCFCEVVFVKRQPFHWLLLQTFCIAV